MNNALLYIPNLFAGAGSVDSAGNEKAYKNTDISLRK